MKRRFAAALLLASALVSAGCSFTCEFVVVNDSDAPLEVRYTHKASAMQSGGRIEVPGVLGADRVNKTGKEWRNMPPERYTIDYKTGHVSVKVAPGEALLVTRVSGCPGQESQHSDSSFNIDSLDLEGAKGSAKYQGRQALMQFTDNGKYTYVIRYR